MCTDPRPPSASVDGPWTLPLARQPTAETPKGGVHAPQLAASGRPAEALATSTPTGDPRPWHVQPVGEQGRASVSSRADASAPQQQLAGPSPQIAPPTPISSTPFVQHQPLPHAQADTPPRECRPAQPHEPLGGPTQAAQPCEAPGSHGARPSPGTHAARPHVVGQPTPLAPPHPHQPTAPPSRPSGGGHDAPRAAGEERRAEQRAPEAALAQFERPSSISPFRFAEPSPSDSASSTEASSAPPHARPSSSASPHPGTGPMRSPRSSASDPPTASDPLVGLVTPYGQPQNRRTCEGLSSSRPPPASGRHSTTSGRTVASSGESPSPSQSRQRASQGRTPGTSAPRSTPRRVRFTRYSPASDGRPEPTRTTRRRASHSHTSRRCACRCLRRAHRRRQRHAHRRLV